MKPDVEVPADQALLTAHLLGLKKALAKHGGTPAIADELKKVIAAKEEEMEKMKTKEVPARPNAHELR